MEKKKQSSQAVSKTKKTVNKKNLGKSSSKTPKTQQRKTETPNPAPKPAPKPVDPAVQAEKEKRHYCSNKALLAEMYKWRDSFDDPDPEKRGKPSEEMGKMLIMIAERISNHSFFRNYPKELKEDMQMYAIEKMISGMKNFNFKYTNVFAYFTKACFNAFKTQLSKHYKQVNLKRDRTRMAMIRLEADMPGSSMGKCLKNQFTGYEDADPWGDGED